MTITKADLATLLHEKLGLNKREAADIVMAFFEEISAELERGDTVKLSGFGVFCLRNKNSRPGRNPKTGEMIPVSARRVVMFHPSHILKTLVHQQRPAINKNKVKEPPLVPEEQDEELSLPT
ncbi:MAG: integration host factor subunit alpha [Betaproteobacteria bacterium]|jgi:integration host factor subunit alpha